MKKKSVLFVGALLVSVIAVGFLMRPTGYRVVDIGNTKGLIIKDQIASKDMGILHQCSREGPKLDSIKGFWTPDVSDIEKLEHLLPSYLKEKATEIDGSDYTRYYLGILYPDKKIIYVDFRRVNPKRDIYKGFNNVICDGGNSFFGIEYDVNSGSFSSLNFNGQG